MTIAPVVVTVIVQAPPERAFELFAKRIGRWWPAGIAVGAKPHVDIVIEPFAGGRWFERDESGAETPWGKVLAWEPPGRLLLGWQLTSGFAYDPEFLTEVELTFVRTPTGGSEVTLEHRNLERFGADAAKVAGQVGGGWPRIVANFVQFADSPLRA